MKIPFMCQDRLGTKHMKSWKRKRKSGCSGTAGGLYELPHPDCDPFRAMMAHPPVVQRLSWMLGHGYHETQEPIANLWPPGTGGCVAIVLDSSALYCILLHTSALPLNVLCFYASIAGSRCMQMKARADTRSQRYFICRETARPSFSISRFMQILDFLPRQAQDSRVYR